MTGSTRKGKGWGGSGSSLLHPSKGLPEVGFNSTCLVWLLNCLGNTCWVSTQCSGAQCKEMLSTHACDESEYCRAV